MRLTDLIGKEVQIYPGDSNRKFGIIEGVEDQGVIFKITHSNCPTYKVDSIMFISFSANLRFAAL